MNRWTMRVAVAVLVGLTASSCASGESLRNAPATVSHATSTSLAPTTIGDATTSTASTTSEPSTTSTSTAPSDSTEQAWIGRTIELRLPPGGEGIDYGFDPHNMQTTVWIDGAPSGLWAWEFIGYFGAGGQPRFGVAVIGVDADPHRAQWEEEANRQYPLPEVVPYEDGEINDLMLWALAEDDVRADGTGTKYTIVDSQPFRLVESETWTTTSSCYYTDWDWTGDTTAPFLFGWVDSDDYGPYLESSEPDPVAPRIAFEVAQTPPGHRIAAVDPRTMKCG